ncbi:MAG: hypothetical protein RIR39_1970 [Pseudomonadota bacterium]
MSDYSTTTMAGMFKKTSEGAKQGAARQGLNQALNLSSGVFYGSTSAEKIWGGMPLTREITKRAGTAPVTRATTNARIMGFSTIDGANHIVQDQAIAGLYSNTDTIQFYPIGSRVPIWVRIDDALASSLLTGVDYVATQVSWDFTNHRIITYDAGVGVFTPKIELISQSGNTRLTDLSGTDIVTTTTITGSKWTYSVTAGALALIIL